MALHFETLDPDSLINITPIVKDGSDQKTHGVAFRMTLGELGAYLASGGAIPAATTTVLGVVKQSAYQAPAAAADVAALKAQLDALVVKLVAAGLMAGS